MLPGIFFAFWRIVEIVTLIPIVGMLSWFVNGFQKNNQLTPTFILTLFIVSVLAAAWALGTLITYHRSRSSGAFIAFIDLCFVGALIAGVYELRSITSANCAHFSGSSNDIYLNLGPFGYVGGTLHNPLALNVNKSCSMLKASFALAIMNIIFFFVTFLLALWVGHHNRNEYDGRRRNERVVYETRHHSSRSPRRSHQSHRSSHSRSHRHAII